jgi:hypothetical protein
MLKREASESCEKTKKPQKRKNRNALFERHDDLQKRRKDLATRCKRLLFIVRNKPLA